MINTGDEKDSAIIKSGTHKEGETDREFNRLKKEMLLNSGLKLLLEGEDPKNIPYQFQTDLANLTEEWQGSSSGRIGEIVTRWVAGSMLKDFPTFKKYSQDEDFIGVIIGEVDGQGKYLIDAGVVIGESPNRYSAKYTFYVSMEDLENNEREIAEKREGLEEKRKQGNGNSTK